LAENSFKCPKCGNLTLNVLEKREIWCLACENRISYKDEHAGGGQHAAPPADSKPEVPGSRAEPRGSCHGPEIPEAGSTRPHLPKAAAAHGQEPPQSIAARKYDLHRMPKTVINSLIRAFFQDLHIVVTVRNSPTMLVRLEKRSVSADHKRVEPDEDLGPIEVEEGVFLEFVCHGDSRVRRHFQQRSIIDSKTFAPREYQWVCAYEEGSNMAIFEFPGRLYNYADEADDESKTFKISGKIMASSMFVTGR